MTWTIFVHLKATSQWLSHSREDRERIAADCLKSIFVDDRVSMRFFDAEAFHATCSDLAMFETTDLQAYYFVMERLRDTALIAAPYFEITNIIPAIENGFRQFEQAEAARG